MNPESGVPKPNDLNRASGNVVWAESNRYTVFFRLSDSDRTYFYPSKAGDLAVVGSYLSPAVGPQVSVLYGPPESGQSSVWEITSRDQPLRTYEQIRQHWTTDNHRGRWGGLVLLLAAVYLYRESRKENAASEA